MLSRPGGIWVKLIKTKKHKLKSHLLLLTIMMLRNAGAGGGGGAGRGRGTRRNGPGRGSAAPIGTSGDDQEAKKGKGGSDGRSGEGGEHGGRSSAGGTKKDKGTRAAGSETRTTSLSLSPNTRSVIGGMSPRTRAAVLAASPNTRSKAIRLEVARRTLPFTRRMEEEENSVGNDESDYTEETGTMIPVQKKAKSQRTSKDYKSPRAGRNNNLFGGSVDAHERRMTTILEGDGNNDIAHGTQVTNFGAGFRIDSVIKDVIFPMIKFAKFETDLQFSNKPESICQIVRAKLQIPVEELEDWWDCQKKIVYARLKQHRNNIIKGIQKLFKGENQRHR